MGARPEHGVLSHALALSANGVDVGEVDEVVEDEGGRDSGRERKRTCAWEKERKRKRGQGRARRPTRRETKRKSGRGGGAGEETGDKERRVDDEGRRR